jgi:hypothetical protein
LKLYYKIRLILRRWMLRRLPPCDQLVPFASESFDRKLPLRKRLVLRLHLFVCLRCRRYLLQLNLIRTTVRAKSAKLLVEEAAESSLSLDARERIKHALDSQKN